MVVALAGELSVIAGAAVTTVNVCDAVGPGLPRSSEQSIDHVYVPDENSAVANVVAGVPLVAETVRLKSPFMLRSHVMLVRSASTAVKLNVEFVLLVFAFATGELSVTVGPVVSTMKVLTPVVLVLLRVFQQLAVQVWMPSANEASALLL